MGLKQIIKEEKAAMLPARFRFNHIFLPVWFVFFLAHIALIIVFGSIDEHKYLPLMIVNFALIAAELTVLLVCGLSLAKKELAFAMEEYGYLFMPTEGRTEAEAIDEELGIKFRLKEDGVTIYHPKKDEEVFEEIGGDAEFLPWAGVRMALATDNFGRRVRLAVVLLDSARAVDEEFEPYFLTLTKELFEGLVGLKLQEKFAPDFAYLLKNPQKGMKQILDFGYIRKFS